MWAEPRIKLAMSLADERGKFLYEILPEFAHYGFLTDLEMDLWARYLEWKQSLIKAPNK